MIVSVIVLVIALVIGTPVAFAIGMSALAIEQPVADRGAVLRVDR